jgi:hypothetical protein
VSSGVNMQVFLSRLFFWVTARRWNALIASTLGQLEEAGVIDSRQLHVIAKEFDPTQRGRVGRIVSGGRNVRYASALLRSDRP